MPIVTNAVFDAIGQPIRATVTVRLVAGSIGDVTAPGYTADGTVLTTYTAFTGDDGLWEIDLPPNADYLPDGTYYEVQERARGSNLAIVSYAEVPDEEGPLPLAGLLVEPTGDPDPLYLLATQKGAAGGLATLDQDGQVPADQLANASGGGGGGTPSSTVVSETTYGQSSTAGVASTYSRGDHTHGSPALTSASPAASAVGDAAAVGVATAPARADHRHAREAFGAVTAQTAYGASSASGSASTLARSDHTHGTPALPTPGAIGAATTTHAATHAPGNSDDISATFVPWADVETPNGVASLDGSGLLKLSELPDHASTHGDGGGDEITIATSQVTGLDTALSGKQPLDSDLTTLASLTATTDNMIQSVAGAWASRTPSQVKTALAIAISDVASLQTSLDGKQALDSDLTAIAGLSPTNDDVIQRKAGAWTNRTPAQLKTDLAVGISDVSGLQTVLDAKAALASPTFTGTPAAPTASQGTSTTQLATTAFVQTEAGLLVPKSLVDAKGDLLVGSAADTVGRLAAGTDGHVLTLDSAESLGVKWAAAAGGGGGADLKPGAYPRTGLWYRAPSFGPVGSNVTTPVSTLFLVPFRLGATTTFDRITCDVTGVNGTGAVMRMGIWAADASGSFPGTLILDAGTISTPAGDTTGQKIVTISQQLTAGTYWLGVVAQTAGGGSVRGSTSYDPLIPYFTGAGANFGATAPGGIQTGATVSGALASTPTITDNNNGPIIGLRAA